MKEARAGCLRETPHIKKEASMGWREMSNDLFLKTCVSSGFLSLSLCLSICLYWFGFVGLFFFFFFRLSFIQILALVVLSFYHFGGSFHFWALLWGLVLRPFSTCVSLMPFSPFCMFLVACFSSGCFFFCCCCCCCCCCCYLLSRGRRRAPFFVCVRPFRGFLVWFFKIFFPGPYSTHLFPLLVLFSAVCRAWIHSLFSFFS